MHKAFWHFMVKHPNFSAYDASLLLTLNFNRYSPFWTFQRIGQTKYVLENGTRIYVGGLHANNTNPSFYIYNDIITIDKNNNIHIYGYPTNIFSAITDPIIKRINKNILSITGGIINIQNNNTYLQIKNNNIYKLNVKTMKII